MKRHLLPPFSFKGFFKGCVPYLLGLFFFPSFKGYNKQGIQAALTGCVPYQRFYPQKKRGSIGYKKQVCFLCFTKKGYKQHQYVIMASQFARSMRTFYPMLFVSPFRCIFSFEGILRKKTLSIFWLLKSSIRDTTLKKTLKRKGGQHTKNYSFLCFLYFLKIPIPKRF